MEKRYYCPVCSKYCKDMTELRECIEKHEVEERKAKAEKERKEKAARAAELEKKIQELSKGLQEAIESYNKVKTGKTYTVKISISEAKDFSYEDYYDMYKKVLSNILK